MTIYVSVGSSRIDAHCFKLLLHSNSMDTPILVALSCFIRNFASCVNNSIPGDLVVEAGMIWVGVT